MTMLFCKDNAGHMRVWDIHRERNDIIITHGVLGGQMQQKIETVPQGKVNRTIDEQIELQINSRINKQLDKGYVHTIDEAKLGMRNALHLPKPMLALQMDKVKSIDYSSAFVQRKYDGNRCLIANRDGKLIAYTRQGKVIETIDHVLQQIKIPNGMILDGELYAHGERLQHIASWIKRKQPNTTKLKYHVYDLVCEMPFSQRLEQLLDLKLNTAIVETVSSYKVKNHEEVLEWFKDFRKAGYEGAILRTGDLGYEDGKRSKSLIKVKQWQDDEFFVVDVYQSKDGWAILECIAKSGATFRVTAPGTHEEKEYVWNNREQFLGKYLTVEYAYFTKDGLPFHPVAKCWRDDND